MKQVMAGNVALLLAVILPTAMRADDDPIKAKLEMAKAAYKADFEKLEKVVSEYFDQEEKAARKVGDTKMVEQISGRRLAFKAFGEVPDAVPLTLKRAAFAARAALENAYKTAVEAYENAEKVDEHNAVWIDWKKLKSPNPGSTWTTSRLA